MLFRLLNISTQAALSPPTLGRSRLQQASYSSPPPPLLLCFAHDHFFFSISNSKGSGFPSSKVDLIHHFFHSRQIVPHNLCTVHYVNDGFCVFILRNLGSSLPTFLVGFRSYANCLLYMISFTNCRFNSRF